MPKERYLRYPEREDSQSESKCFDNSAKTEKEPDDPPGRQGGGPNSSQQNFLLLESSSRLFVKAKVHGQASNLAEALRFTRTVQLVQRRILRQRLYTMRPR